MIHGPNVFILLRVDLLKVSELALQLLVLSSDAFVLVGQLLVLGLELLVLPTFASTNTETTALDSLAGWRGFHANDEILGQFLPPTKRRYYPMQ